MNKMINACRLLAQHIQSVPLEEELYGELRFLREEFVEMLQDKTNQAELLNDYVDSEEDQEILNPWLRELTNNYFK
jgi:hypothetical protein